MNLFLNVSFSSGFFFFENKNELISAKAKFKGAKLFSLHTSCFNFLSPYEATKFSSGLLDNFGLKRTVFQNK